MIDWKDAINNPPEPDMNHRYLVTAEYRGKGNVSGRKTFSMTYELRGRKQVPTWCWEGRASMWKVLYYAEYPCPCLD